MLVDLSAMARYFSLGAVALGLNENIAEYVDILYAEAVYGDIIDTTTVDIPEHSASWEAIAIPRAEGDWFPTHLRHFVVSVGFEGAKVARLADRGYPDAISVLMPMPGLRAEYEDRSLKANEGWMKVYGVGDDARIGSSPADAIASWRCLSGFVRIDPSYQNVYCLLCGSKPQSLGMTLYALSRERPAAMYVRPTMHEEQSIEASGVYWKFRLRDRTLLPVTLTE